MMLRVVSYCPFCGKRLKTVLVSRHEHGLHNAVCEKHGRFSIQISSELP